MQEKLDARRRLPDEELDDPSAYVSGEAISALHLELQDAKLEPKQRAYILALAMTGGRTFRAACLAHVAMRTVGTWRRDSNEFAEMEQRAQRIWVETLEQEADRRAFVGVEKPVFGSLGTGMGSGEVGRIREYSDRLLEFRLRALDPDKYADRKKTEHSGPGGGAIPIEAVRNELAEKFARQREQRVAHRLPPPSESSGDGPVVASTPQGDVPQGTLDSAPLGDVSPGERGTL